MEDERCPGDRWFLVAWITASAASGCNDDCDRPPYYYVHDRCPRTIGQSDRITLDPDPLAIILPHPMGEELVEPSVTTVQLRIFNFVRGREDKEDTACDPKKQTGKEACNARPADHLRASLSVHPCSDDRPTCDTFEGGGVEFTCVPGEGPDPQMENLIRLVPVAEADGGTEETGPVNCIADGESSLECITMADGGIQFDVVADAAVGRFPNYYLLLDSGEDCRATPIALHRGIPAGSRLDLVPSAPMAGMGAGSCPWAGPCWRVPVGQEEPRCNETRFACEATAQAIEVLAVLKGSDEFPIVSPERVPVWFELTTKRPRGESSRPGLLDAWISPTSDCAAGEVADVFELMNGRLTIYLCTNGASGSVSISASAPFDYQIAPAVAGFSVEALPSQVEVDFGEPNAAGERDVDVAVMGCDGRRSESVRIGITVDEPASLLEPPPQRTGSKGKASARLQLATDAEAVLHVKLPSAGSTCAFPITG